MAPDATLYWPNLCGNASEYDAFWSDQLTLNTSTPVVTSCFQNTVLIWVPCGLLWLMTPVYAVYVAKRPLYRPWTSCSKLNASKLTAAIALTLVALVSLIYKATKHEDGSVITADVISLVVLFLTYGLAAFYTQWTFCKRLHACVPLFIFWMLLLVAKIITLRSQTVMSAMSDIAFACLCLEVGLVSVEFLLSLISDREAVKIKKILAEEKTPLLSGSCPKNNNANPCPRQSASVMSQWLFLWFIPKFILALRKTLVASDIWDVTDEMSAKVNYSLLKSNSKTDNLAQEPKLDTREVLSNSGVKGDVSTKETLGGSSRRSLFLSLVKTFLPFFSWSAVHLLVYVAANFAGPILLQALIVFIEGQDPYTWKGYILAVTLYLTSCIAGLAQQHHVYTCLNTGINIRGALTAAIYRKTLLLSNSAQREISVGNLINLISVDVETITPCLAFLNYAWGTPLSVIISMILLWQQIGPSSLVGLLLLIALFALNSIIMAGKLKKTQQELMNLKSRRLKLTSQILSGIKVLKLHAWEPYFENYLEKLRRQELFKLRRVVLLITLTFAAWFAAPFLVSVVCFAAYTLSSKDNVLDAQKTFVSLSLISGMYWPLMAVSQVIGNTVQALVSVNRIQEYLFKDVLQETPRHQSSDCISVLDGTFTWDSEKMPCLKDISIQVKQGDLVAVVGIVGSGKSSLLSALLGELETVCGSVKMQGSVAYVPQQAWIQNLTLQDNILFSSDMNRTNYNAVLDACALRPDLKVIPGGDMAEIGEKGINLSGGQKQRVSLARAVYNNRDIYLLDDPLSAVDSHVGKHIFEQVIGKKGILRNKTRILVTHGISHLSEVDYIIVMKDGCISEVGSHQELLNNNGAFAEFLKNYTSTNLDDELGEFVSESGKESCGSERRTLPRRRRTSTASTRSRHSIEVRQLITEEKASSGTIKLSVLAYLLKAAGCSFLLLLLASVLLFIISQCLTQLWLRDWTQDQTTNGTQSEKTVMRLGGYGGLAVLQVASIVGISVSIAFGGMKASSRLHSRLLCSVFHSPMSFFDTTPLGRILNRFSRDMNAVDQLIPVNAQIFLSSSLPVVAVVFIVVYTLPICAAIVVPLALVLFLAQRLYIVCASQLQRLDAICRSPLYAFVEETFMGVTTIRAFGHQNILTERMERLLDKSNCVAFEVLSSNRAYNSAVQTLGNLVCAFTAVFGIIYRDTLDASTLGMAVSFGMQIGRYLSICTNFMGLLEVQMVSVERIEEYSDLESESPWQVPDNEPPEEWPEEGAVEFWEYNARYRPELDLVLKEISCKIQPREKIGIVGRTGAGKSSLTLALFRLIEADSGLIAIDGRDIGRMGLHDVRGRISIIPQDPVMFSGTLRFNIDPSGKHTERDIWEALERSYLKTFVASLPDGLQHMCDEGGGNLSVGQRQLVCLTRALLRMSKVLVLDEATAAVDVETDDLIQTTVRSQFKHCTVVTIAHRLNTIMDYDRVMVMEDGRIREVGSPATLVADTTSLFHAMARDANLV